MDQDSIPGMEFSRYYVHENCLVLLDLASKPSLESEFSKAAEVCQRWLAEQNWRAGEPCPVGFYITFGHV